MIKHKISNRISLKHRWFYNICETQSNGDIFTESFSQWRFSFTCSWNGSAQWALLLSCCKRLTLTSIFTELNTHRKPKVPSNFYRINSICSLNLTADWCCKSRLLSFYTQSADSEQFKRFVYRQPKLPGNINTCVVACWAINLTISLDRWSWSTILFMIFVDSERMLLSDFTRSCSTVLFCPERKQTCLDFIWRLLFSSLVLISAGRTKRSPISPSFRYVLFYHSQQIIFTLQPIFPCVSY